MQDVGWVWLTGSFLQTQPSCLPTTTWVDSSSTSDLRRFGALWRNFPSGASESFGLCGCFFLQWNELVAQLSGLAFDLLFEPFVTLGIPGGPDGFVIFNLFGENGVENNGDLVCGRGGGCLGSEFGLHAAQVVSERRGTAM